MKFESHSIGDTAKFAEELLAFLKLNNIKYILLNGELGAGKTTLVKELVRISGSGETAVSPTFSIHNSYSVTGGYILHSDLYRIESEQELEQTGFYELAEGAELAFIEWGDRFGLKDVLERYAEIDIIKLGEKSREFTLTIAG